MVRRVGVGDVLIPTHRGNPRGRSIKTLLRFLQSRLVSIDIKLDTDCPYEYFVHKGSIVQGVKHVKTPLYPSPKKGRLSHPLLKRQGFPKVAVP